MNKEKGDTLRRLEEMVRCSIVTDEAELRQKSDPVSKAWVIESKLDQVLQQAVKAGWTNGAAISAIQIGVRAQFAYYDFDIPELKPGLKKVQNGIMQEDGVIRPLDPKNDIVNVHFGPVFLLNPFFKSKKNLVRVEAEGCLSMPNKRYSTWRFNEVTVYNAWDASEITATGFAAWVIQHEIQHMEGGLCYDSCRIERNDKCPCGSQLKAKRCCLGKLQNTT